MPASSTKCICARRPENRSTQAAIAALAVPSAKLGSVTLENVADFEPGTSPTDINRQARQRQVTVFCNLLPTASQAAVQAAMLAEFNRLNTSGEYRGVLAGRSRELGRAAQNFVTAFVLSLVFMYLIWRRSSSRGSTRSPFCCRCR